MYNEYLTGAITLIKSKKNLVQVGYIANYIEIMENKMWKN